MKLLISSSADRRIKFWTSGGQLGFRFRMLPAHWLIQEPIRLNPSKRILLNWKLEYLSWHWIMSKSLSRWLIIMIHFRRQQLIIGVNKGIRIYNLITDVESEHHIDASQPYTRHEHTDIGNLQSYSHYLRHVLISIVEIQNGSRVMPIRL